MTHHRNRNLSLFQVPVEETDRSLIGHSPTPPQQEIVNFVRKNQFLHGHVSAAQRIGQHYSLVELHVAVVIALNQEHGRTPAAEESHGRSFKRGFVIRRSWRNAKL